MIIIPSAAREPSEAALIKGKKQMLDSLIKKARTIRRFDKERPVKKEDILHIIDLARLSPSAANLQRIRYLALLEKESKSAFSKVRLGGYLSESERPDESVGAVAYIAICAKEKEPDANLCIDMGIAAEAITLTACEMGLGTCIIRNFDKEYFDSFLKERCVECRLVIAIGYPLEEATVVPIGEGGSIKYYKNESGVNCVPKRSLDDVVLEIVE